MSVRVNIASFKGRFRNNVGALKRAVMMKLFATVIMDTPVGNEDTWDITEAQKKWLKDNGYKGGRLRGAWAFTVDTPAAPSDVSTDDPTDTIRAQVASSVSEADGSVFLTNNMPYARPVEYDGWSHTKAPNGMVRQNMLRFSELIKKEASSR